MPQYDLTFDPTLAAGSRLAWTIPQSMVTSPPVTTYTEVYRWNIASGSSNTSGSGDYYTQGTGTGILDGALFVNRTPAQSPGANAPQLIQIAELNTLNTSSDTFRLRAVGNAGGANGLPAGKSGVTTGSISINTSPFGSFTRFTIQVGGASGMRDAFGDPTINVYQGGGHWILERVSTTPGTSVEEDLYRIIRRPNAANSPPNIDTTRWTALSTSDWNATATYSTVGTLVTDSDNLYSLTSAIPAFSTTLVTWRADLIAQNGTARYSYGGGNNGWVVVNNNANSGTFPTDLTGTWTLRQVGGASISGPLTVVSTFPGNRRIRVGSQSQMIQIFGIEEIASDGNFELVKIANAAPSVDTARWSQIVVTDWDRLSAYQQNAVVYNVESYFRANVNIAVPTKNQIIRRSALTNGDVIMWQYDTDAAQGSRLSFRVVGGTPADAILLENGTPLTTESGVTLRLN